MKTKLIHIVSCLFFTTLMVAQNPVQTSIDTTHIKIGDTFGYTIKVSAKENSKVFFPESEQFGAFEVIDNLAVDTVKSDGVLELIKRYDLTSFDEGEFTVPELPIIIDANQFKTDSLSVQVAGVEVDTLKTPLYDIKNVSTAGASISSNWYYLLLVFISILVGIALYIYIKRRQDANLTEEDIYKTPYEKAVKKLKSLDEKKTWVKDDPKQYYSDMTDITRSFLEDTFDIAAHELTTFETITILKNTLKNNDVKIDPIVVKEFKRVLETADLVKFAKSQPTDQEIANDTLKTQKIVDDINIAYPISAATQTERIRKREERKRKRKQFRVWVPVLTSIGLLFVLGIAYLVNTSAERDWTFLTFNNTKKLLKKEWITSEYGSNPGLTLSTPSVLLRNINPPVQTTVPEGVVSLQQFVSGDYKDPLTIMLSTIEVDEKYKYSDDKLINHAINVLTQNYKASNVKHTTDAYENANGLKGLRIKSTFSSSITKESSEENIVLEGVLSTNGVNKTAVWVFYTEGDKLAPKLVERVFESMEYKQETE